MNVAIFGCGGLGQMTQDILVQAGRCSPVAFLDSDPNKHARKIDGVPVVGGLESLASVIAGGVHGVVVAIGDNRTRVSIATEIERRGARLVGAVHPLASISPSARIAEHVIIGPRAIICVNAAVGPHSILAAGSIADHDTRIGVGCHLHPASRLAGAVQVEDLATIGIGACVIPACRIGAGANVAAGAVVIRDVRPNETVAGVPAKPVCGSGSRFTPESLPVNLPPVREVPTPA